MLSMIEEALGFGGSGPALCGYERESQAKTHRGPPQRFWPWSEWEKTGVINLSALKTRPLSLPKYSRCF